MRKVLPIILAATLLGFIANPVWSAGTLKVTTPNGGQKWTTGKKYNIKWSKGNAGASVKIQLLKSGKAYKTIKAKTKNDGKHRWKVPSTLTTGSAYTIKITSTKNKKVFDSSNKNFTITKKSGTSSVFSKKDYKFLQKHNAYLWGKTSRFKTKVIDVSGADSAAWRTAINRWRPTVRFRFVSSRANKGIHIVYGSLSGTYCGWAQRKSYSDGSIRSCLITLETEDRCNPHPQLRITHEVGHCLGFRGHTTDGGLMQARTASTVITPPVRTFMKLLYSMPMGTNIKPHL